MSAASTASDSSPSVPIRSPFVTLHRTTFPDFPPCPLPPPFLHPPRPPLPPLPPVPPPRQQDARVAAELQHVDRPLGERQHAEQFQRVGVVQQDLLLPADRQQRRPRAGRHRRDCG